MLLILLAAITAAWSLDAFRDLDHYTRLIMQRLALAPLKLPYPDPPPRDQWKTMSASERLTDVTRRVKPLLEQKLAARGLRFGNHVFIRLFKENRELEIWLQDAAGAWHIFQTYPIACFSGELGPKQREGDMQAPEGFYAVTAKQLNPASSYHLAFNIGYPNAFDLQHQRTGSLIMVHGDEVSVGCYAMTDPVIEEIYLLVAAALENGQPEVPVHCFPFRFTPTRMDEARNQPWHTFWENLREGCESFDKHLAPPVVQAVSGRYHISPGR